MYGGQRTAVCYGKKGEQEPRIIHISGLVKCTGVKKSPEVIVMGERATLSKKEKQSTKHLLPQQSHLRERSKLKF